MSNKELIERAIAGLKGYYNDAGDVFRDLRALIAAPEKGN